MESPKAPRVLSALYYTFMVSVVFSFCILAFSSSTHDAFAATQSNNHIRNGNFSTLSKGMPDDWHGVSSGKTRAIFSVKKTDTFGNAAHIVVPSGHSGIASWTTDPITVTPNTAYRFGDRYLAQGAPSYVVVTFTHDNGSTTHTQIAETMQDAQFMPIFVSFTIPSDVHHITLSHELHDTGSLSITDATLLPGYMSAVPSIKLASSSDSSSSSSFAKSSSASASSANLITNPSVEQGQDNTPVGWKPGGYGTNTASLWYASQYAHSGNHFITTTINSYTSGDSKWYFSQVPTSGGTTYTYGDWYRSTIPTWITADYSYPNGNHTYTDLGTTGASESWAPFTATFTVPQGATKLTIFHLIKQPGTLDTDDFSLTRGTTSTGPSSSSSSSQSSSSSHSSSSSSQSSSSSSSSGGGTPIVTTSSGGGGTQSGESTSTNQGNTSQGNSQNRSSSSYTGTSGHGVVSINFDDGRQSQFDNALPVLQNEGLQGKATFFIVTDYMNGHFADYMSPTEVKHLASLGYEIGAHTLHHAHLTQISESAARQQIVGSKEALAALGISTRVFAYPFGEYNAAIEKLVKESGFSLARSTNGGINQKGSIDRYALNRVSTNASTPLSDIYREIDQAAQDNAWIILVFHQVGSYPGDAYSATPERLTQIINYAKSKHMSFETLQQAGATYL